MMHSIAAFGALIAKIKSPDAEVGAVVREIKIPDNVVRFCIQKSCSPGAHVRD